MSDQITINVIQESPVDLNITDTGECVELNPITLNQGIINHSVTHQSGGSDELSHNLLGGLQGGSGDNYFHLSHEQYTGLVTGVVIRPSDTGAFYPTSNPSGFITGVNLSNYATIPFVTGISGELQEQINNLDFDTGDFISRGETGDFYPRSNPSGFITGVNLSGYVTGDVIRPSDTGAFYPASNPSGFITGVNLSGYVTGQVVRPSETGNFITASQTGQFYPNNNPSGFITGVDLSGYVTGEVIRPSQTGDFYPRSNPSGFITGVDLSGYVTGAVVRPSETGSFLTTGQTGDFYPRSNPSGFITGINLSGYVTGEVVRPSETGNFITTAQTGAFYPTSNPSGFITGVNLSGYVTGDVVRPSETGNFITSSQTGAFYPSSNPSGFITGVDLSNYATVPYVTGLSGNLQQQITTLNNQTGSYVLDSETGQFYPASNPSGFITGIPNIVYTTGDQDISGLKDFQTRPTVVDIPVLVSGDSVDTIHLYAKNNESFTLLKGQPVFIDGANGANPLISLASNTGERTSSKTIGLMAQDVLSNAFGYIVSEGMLEGFNTSSGNAGDPMWLGQSGNIIYGTGNKPYGNNHLVYLGVVLRSNVNNGKVYVKIQNGFEINELHKVYAQNSQNKDTLLYDSGSGAWISRQIGTGDVSGLNNYYLASNPSGFAIPADPVRTTLSGDGSTSVYAISGASGLVNPSALIVAIDGAMQEPIVDYTVASGNITFTSPLPSGSKAVVISPTNSLQVSQMIPADGSVSSSKLDTNLSIAGELTLPNQTLSQGSSAVNRDLGDTRYNQSITVVKQTDTSRSSTTTFANDPHLVINIPSTGLWRVELYSYFTAADNTGGAKIQLQYSGSLSAPRSFWESRTNNQGVVYPAGALTTVMRGGSVGTVAFPISITAATNRTIAACLTAMLDLTSTGSLAIQWAQNTSSATATTFAGGSFLTATKVGN